MRDRHCLQIVRLPEGQIPNSGVWHRVRHVRKIMNIEGSRDCHVHNYSPSAIQFCKNAYHDMLRVLVRVLVCF